MLHIRDPVSFDSNQAHLVIHVSGTNVTFSDRKFEEICSCLKTNKFCFPGSKSSLPIATEENMPHSTKFYTAVVLANPNEEVDFLANEALV